MKSKQKFMTINYIIFRLIYSEINLYSTKIYGIYIQDNINSDERERWKRRWTETWEGIEQTARGRNERGSEKETEGNTCREGSCHDDLRRISRAVAAASPRVAQPQHKPPCREPPPPPSVLRRVSSRRVSRPTGHAARHRRGPSRP